MAQQPLVVDVAVHVPKRHRRNTLYDDSRAVVPAAYGALQRTPSFPVRYQYLPAKSTQCAFRCGHDRTPGSDYCRHDTCRADDCTKSSKVWDGYCKDHGCAAAACEHRRATTKLSCPAGCRHHVASPSCALSLGASRYRLSDYCKTHMCRVWGCRSQGKRDLASYCHTHFRDFYEYC